MKVVSKIGGIGLLITFVLYLSQIAAYTIPDVDPPSVSGMGLIEVSSQEPPIKHGNSKGKRLCPEGTAFYNETNICEKLSEQGPCGELQAFYALSKDADYGNCACLNNAGCSGNVKNHRTILSADDNSRCYWSFTQGPCDKEEWYVLNLETLEPQCQTNPCLSSPQDLESADSVPIKKPQNKDDMFPFAMNGTCYRTFSKGFCTEGKYVQFFGTTDPYPKCYSVNFGAPKCLLGVGPVVGMPCEPGYKLVGDDCVMANIEFD